MAHGVAPARGPSTQAALAAPDDGLSPAARAFLASERERKRREEAPDAGRVLAEATIAPTWGGRVAGAPALPSRARGPSRSLMFAYALWWFGAPFAAHRFYLRATRSAFVMLFLFWGGLGIGLMMSSKSGMWLGGVAVPPLGVLMVLSWMLWTLVDAFLIPGLRRRAQRPASDGLSEVFR